MHPLQPSNQKQNARWGIEFNQNPTSEANQMGSNQINSITFELKLN